MKANALEMVKNNVRELCRLGKKVVFRCVIIPGFNDNAEHIARVVACLLYTSAKTKLSVSLSQA